MTTTIPIKVQRHSSSLLSQVAESLNIDPEPFNSWFFIFILFILLSINFYLLSPFLSNENIAGWGSDPYFCLYVVKQLANKFNLGIFPWRDEFWDLPFFFPAKQVLAFSDPLILPGLTVYILNKLGVDTLLAFNIIFIINLFLNWLFASLVLKRFISSQQLAIVCGWLLGFSSHLLSQSAHFQNTYAWLFFMALYGALSLKDRTTFSPILVLFFGVFLLGITNLYYLAFTIIAVGLLIFSVLIYPFAIGRCLSIVSTVSIALISLTPVISRYHQVRDIYPPETFSRPFELQVHFSARVIDFFTSNLISPLYSSFLPLSENFERNSFIGLFSFLVTLLGFLIIPIFFLKTKKDINLRQGYLLGTFLSLGGVFIATAPWACPSLFISLRETIPGVADLRAIGRIGIMTTLGFAILSCIFIQQINLFFERSKLRSLVIFLFLTPQIAERVIPEFRDSWRAFKSVELKKNEVQLTRNQGVAYLEYSFSPMDNYNAHALIEGLINDVKVINGYSGYSPPGYDFDGLREVINNCNGTLDRYSQHLKNTKWLTIRSIPEGKKEVVLNCFKTLGFLEKPKLIEQVPKNN
jgi:hypothetical protein